MRKENKPDNNTLFDATTKQSPLDFSARGLDGRIFNFEASFSTSVEDVSKILKVWKSMEETASGIKDPTQQAEERFLLPARQLAYPFKNVSLDDICGNFDVATLNDMVTHVAGILMGAGKKDADSTD